MRVFVAGGSGAHGRSLVPQLVGRGHQVTATCTNADKLCGWHGCRPATKRLP
jgi:uncharacterized protein YbjT (DUF2867 family)